jgi:hypothetical protein
MFGSDGKCSDFPAWCPVSRQNALYSPEYEPDIVLIEPQLWHAFDVDDLLHTRLQQHSIALGGRIDCIQQLRPPRLSLRSSAFLIRLCFALAQAVTAVRFFIRAFGRHKNRSKSGAQPRARRPRIQRLLSRSNLFFAFLAQKTLVKPQNHLSH